MRTLDTAVGMANAPLWGVTSLRLVTAVIAIITIITVPII
jgi:hypothetical protein